MNPHDSPYRPPKGAPSDSPSTLTRTSLAPRAFIATCASGIPAILMVSGYYWRGTPPISSYLTPCVCAAVGLVFSIALLRGPTVFKLIGIVCFAPCALFLARALLGLVVYRNLSGFAW